jgi:sodium/potassium-transporting ATPase subunit beta
MLAVFVSFMPRDRPTYYGKESTMNIRGLNPGLGFRPQIDVEDHTIIYNPEVKEDINLGHRKYVNNLRNFLEAKYGEIDSTEKANVFECVSNHNYETEMQNGRSCEFDYKKIFKDTDCSDDKNYGFSSNKPCVLVKLNKIISWQPVPSNETNGVIIKCEGETSVDKDNIKSVTYYSEGRLNDNKHGLLDSKYFPFFSQKSYRAPFIFVQFDLTPNTLVNVECKAYAENIENDDRLNRRGQTKFSLYISNIF